MNLNAYFGDKMNFYRNGKKITLFGNKNILLFLQWNLIGEIAFSKEY